MAEIKSFNPDRLYVQLLNSGIKQQNEALYQVIYQLIGGVLGIISGNTVVKSSQTTTVIQNIIQQGMSDLSGSDSSSDNDSISIPGPQGLRGFTGERGSPGEDGSDGELGMIIQVPGSSSSDAFVPYFIASGETFVVPLFKQALFAMNIDNEGILEVDGFLIEVD